MKSLNLISGPTSLSVSSTRKEMPMLKATSKANQESGTFLEFFAGSGLVTLALKGILTPAWANDICEKKAAVYTANHGVDHFYLGSIVNVKGKDLPEVSLAWASFPCQDLSLAGLIEGIDGARSGLVWEWLRVIDEMKQKPPILIAENVVGLVSVAGGNHYLKLHHALVKRGYLVGAMIIDASRWVPQSRPRIFIVAVDSSITIPEELTSSVPNWLHTDAVRKVAVGLNNWIWWNLPEPPVRKVALSDIIQWEAPFADPKVEARNINLISPKHLTLLNEIPKYKNFAFPGYKRTRYGQQVLELRFDNIAGCLRTPKGGSSRQELIVCIDRKLRNRLLTVRETARLMGAPDSYKLPGSYNDGYKAMGDAVVVPVARWIAQKLLLPLLDGHAK